MPRIERFSMQGHGLDVEPFFFGAAWGPRHETLARQAWEAVQRECQHIGCWRTRLPEKPPHTHHSVFVVGEQREDVQAALDVVMRFQPQLAPPVKEGFREALYLRRIRMAADLLAKGIDPGERMFQHRSETGFTLDKQGRQHPA